MFVRFAEDVHQLRLVLLCQFAPASLRGKNGLVARQDRWSLNLEDLGLFYLGRTRYPAPGR